MFGDKKNLINNIEPEDRESVKLTLAHFFLNVFISHIKEI